MKTRKPFSHSEPVVYSHFFFFFLVLALHNCIFFYLSPVRPRAASLSAPWTEYRFSLISRNTLCCGMEEKGKWEKCRTNTFSLSIYFPKMVGKIDFGFRMNRRKEKKNHHRCRSVPSFVVFGGWSWSEWREKIGTESKRKDLQWKRRKVWEDRILMYSLKYRNSAQPCAAVAACSNKSRDLISCSQGNTTKPKIRDWKQNKKNVLYLWKIHLILLSAALNQTWRIMQFFLPPLLLINLRLDHNKQ